MASGEEPALDLLRQSEFARDAVAGQAAFVLQGVLHRERHLTGDRHEDVRVVLSELSSARGLDQEDARRLVVRGHQRGAHERANPRLSGRGARELAGVNHEIPGQSGPFLIEYLVQDRVADAQA